MSIVTAANVVVDQSNLVAPIDRFAYGVGPAITYVGLILSAGFIAANQEWAL